MPIFELLMGLLALLIFVVLLWSLVLVLTGQMHTIGLKPLQRCFEEIEVHAEPESGDVTFFYHTYRGLIVWCLQEEHQIAAPPGDARKLLGRLLRYNLTWGMRSSGLPFIPLLAIGNYFAQRRSISRQILALNKQHCDAKAT